MIMVCKICKQKMNIDSNRDAVSHISASHSTIAEIRGFKEKFFVRVNDIPLGEMA